MSSIRHNDVNYPVAHRFNEFSHSISSPRSHGIEHTELSRGRDIERKKKNMPKGALLDWHLHTSAYGPQGGFWFECYAVISNVQFEVYGSWWLSPDSPFIALCSIFILRFFFSMNLSPDISQSICYMRWNYGTMIWYFYVLLFFLHSLCFTLCFVCSVISTTFICMPLLKISFNQTKS